MSAHRPLQLVWRANAAGTSLNLANLANTILRAQVLPDANGAHAMNLVIAAHALSAGVKYAFSLSASGWFGTQTSDVSVQMNAAPVGGTLHVSPSTGFALRTNFSLTSTGWSDPEGDLPLQYAFVVDPENTQLPRLRLPAMNLRKTIALSPLGALSALSTWLPQGEAPSFEVLAIVEVVDALGAQNAVSAVAHVQEYIPPPVEQLEEETAALLERAGDDPYAVQLTVQAVSVALTRNTTDNTTNATAARRNSRTQLLVKLNGIGQQAATTSNLTALDSRFAASLSSTLVMVTAATDQLSDTATNAGLSLAQQVAEATGLSDDGVANVATTASNLLTAAQSNLVASDATDPSQARKTRHASSAERGRSVASIIDTVALASVASRVAHTLCWPK